MKLGEKSWRSQLKSWRSRVGEDLVALGQRLALELDPFFRAEDVLEALERPEAELSLAVELGGESEALGDLGDPDRVVVAVGVLAALAVGVLFLVGVEGEDALDAVAERAFEQSGRVAVVAFGQQRRLRRQHAACRRLRSSAWRPRTGRRRCLRSGSRRSRRRRSGRRRGPRRARPGRRGGRRGRGRRRRRRSRRRRGGPGSAACGSASRSRRRAGRWRRPPGPGGQRGRSRLPENLVDATDLATWGVPSDLVLQSGGKWVTVALELKPKGRGGEAPPTSSLRS